MLHLTEYAVYHLEDSSLRFAFLLMTVEFYFVACLTIQVRRAGRLPGWPRRDADAPRLRQKFGALIQAATPHLSLSVLLAMAIYADGLLLRRSDINVKIYTETMSSRGCTEVPNLPWTWKCGESVCSPMRPHDPRQIACTGPNPMEWDFRAATSAAHWKEIQQFSRGDQ